MLNTLFSGDFPRSRWLTGLLLLIAVALLLAPFLFPGSRPLDTAAKVCIFIVLVASYDLLLGYTGVVSFAHTVFFGMGAYGAAIALAKVGPGWGALLTGGALGVLSAMVLALLIALFSLRVRAIFFAMVTLAVASAFAILVSQLFHITGGEDGLSYSLPRELTPAFRLVQDKVFDVRIDGRLLTYYLVLIACAGLFLGLLRLVNSPFGRVLQAIRENEFRAEALGYRTVLYRTLASCIAAGVAALAGVMMAVWARYTGPETTLSMDIMVNILLMVVIGGMGTLYGAVVGATLFVLAQNYLQTLMAGLSSAVSGVPVLPNLFAPDRWLLWLGVLFILSVYFFPTGLVGRLRGTGSGR